MLHVGVDLKCNQSREIHEQLPQVVGEGVRKGDRQWTGQRLPFLSSGIWKATVVSLCSVSSLLSYLGK